MGYRSRVAGATVLVIAALVGTGCGESTEDAEQALCADLSTLRTSVVTLAETSSDTTVDDYKQARENVHEAWADVKASADNLGDERFDDVEDAWEDVADSIDDVDNDATLGEARDEITGTLKTYATAERDLASRIDCSTTDA